MGIQVMGRVPGTEQWSPVEDTQDEDLFENTEEVPGVLIVRLRETLHFANAGALKERLRRLERYGVKKMHPSNAPVRSEAQIIVLYMKDLLGIDASALQILRETCDNYVKRGVQVHLVHVQGELRRTLEKAHLFNLIGKGSVKSFRPFCHATDVRQQKISIQQSQSVWTSYVLPELLRLETFEAVIVTNVRSSDSNKRQKQS